MSNFRKVSQLKLALLVGGAVFLPQAVAAQDAGEDSSQVATADDGSAGEVIVVSGFRASLDAALDIKRNSVTPIDAILAEDIADFPDLNLAESIQRIPGVSIDRDGGEGRTITVRGLNPDFTRVRINGMETLSTTGGTDSSGGTNRGRGFDFNIFASELFQSIKVSKAPSPDQEEGSLGAIVDLQTGKPLSYGKFVLAANVQGQWNDLARKVNPRISGLVSNTWADGRIGALISVAYTKRDILEEGFSSVRWDNADSFSNEASFPGVADAFHPRLPRYGKLISDQERLGITGSLQFEPTDTTRIDIDGLYSKFSGSRVEQFLEAVSFSRNNSSGKRATDIVDVEFDTARNNIIYGEFNDVDVRIENRRDELKTEFKQLTGTLYQDLGDTLKFELFGGISKSDFNNPVQTTVIADRIDVDGYSFDFRDNYKLPAIDYGFDVTDPNNFTVTELRDRPNSVVNKFGTVSGSLDWEASSELSFQTGGSYKKFTFSSEEARRDTVLSSTTVVQPFALTSSNSQLISFGRGLGLPSSVDRSWVVPDIDVIAADTGLYTGNFPAVPRPDAINTVTEEDKAGFLQFSLDTDLGGMRLRGIGGIRYVDTSTESTGILSGNSTTVTNSYDDWLPSLALSLEPTDGLVLRASAQKVMARPTLSSLTPGGTLNAFTQTLSYGNPLLDPFRANSFDIGVDWYFADEGLISASYFYKDVKTFVTRLREDIPYSETGLDPDLLIGSPSTVDDIFSVQRNINGEGGKVEGFEIQLQTPFTFAPGILQNFGVTANYTRVTSSVNYGTEAAPLYADLTGLSRNAANGTLYYEDSKFKARVSVAYRSGYLTFVPGRNNNDVEGKHGATNVDAAMSYKLTDQITLSLEGVNLTDEFNDQYVDSVGDRPYVYQHTGRTFTFGVRFNY